ncbi:hypothetical protein [Klebsiella michiganensis]
MDRLARSVPDAGDIADALQARGVKLALGNRMVRLQTSSPG